MQKLTAPVYKKSNEGLIGLQWLPRVASIDPAVASLRWIYRTRQCFNQQRRPLNVQIKPGYTSMAVFTHGRLSNFPPPY